MPFPCNGVLLNQIILPRVIQVFFQVYINILLVFLSPISIFLLEMVAAALPGQREIGYVLVGFGISLRPLFIKVGVVGW